MKLACGILLVVFLLGAPAFAAAQEQKPAVAIILDKKATGPDEHELAKILEAKLRERGYKVVPEQEVLKKILQPTASATGLSIPATPAALTPLESARLAYDQASNPVEREEALQTISMFLGTQIFIEIFEISREGGKWSASLFIVADGVSKGIGGKCKESEGAPCLEKEAVAADLASKVDDFLSESGNLSAEAMGPTTKKNEKGKKSTAVKQTGSEPEKFDPIGHDPEVKPSKEPWYAKWYLWVVVGGVTAFFVAYAVTGGFNGDSDDTSTNAAPDSVLYAPTSPPTTINW
jgi:hypothetical protein